MTITWGSREAVAYDTEGTPDRPLCDVLLEAGIVRF